MNVEYGFVNMAMPVDCWHEASPLLVLVRMNAAVVGGGLEREQEEREDVGAEFVQVPAGRRGREFVLEKEE